MVMDVNCIDPAAVDVTGEAQFKVLEIQSSRAFSNIFSGNMLVRLVVTGLYLAGPYGPHLLRPPDLKCA